MGINFNLYSLFWCCCCFFLVWRELVYWILLQVGVFICSKYSNQKERERKKENRAKHNNELNNNNNGFYLFISFGCFSWLNWYFSFSFFQRTITITKQNFHQFFSFLNYYITKLYILFFLLNRKNIEKTIFNIFIINKSFHINK